MILNLRGLPHVFILLLNSILPLFYRSHLLVWQQPSGATHTLTPRHGLRFPGPGTPWTDPGNQEGTQERTDQMLCSGI